MVTALQIIPETGVNGDYWSAFDGVLTAYQILGWEGVRNYLERHPVPLYDPQTRERCDQLHYLTRLLNGSQKGEELTEQRFLTIIADVYLQIHGREYRSNDGRFLHEMLAASRPEGK